MSYEVISDNINVIGLLKLIWNVAFSYKLKRYPYLAFHTAMKNLHTNHQKSYTSNNNYMENFQNLVQVADHIEGNFGEHPGFVK